MKNFLNSVQMFCETIASFFAMLIETYTNFWAHTMTVETVLFILVGYTLFLCFGKLALKQAQKHYQVIQMRKYHTDDLSEALKRRRRDRSALKRLRSSRARRFRNRLKFSFWQGVEKHAQKERALAEKRISRCERSIRCVQSSRQRLTTEIMEEEV